MHLKGTAVLLVYTHIRTCIVDIIVSIYTGVSVVGCVYSLWGSKGEYCGVGEPGGCVLL